MVTHPRVLRRPFDTADALSFLAAVFASPSVNILTENARHLEVLTEVSDEVSLLAGSLYHDAHTAALMREHGIRSIVTRDTDSIVSVSWKFLIRCKWVSEPDPLRQRVGWHSLLSPAERNSIPSVGPSGVATSWKLYDSRCYNHDS